MTNVRNDTITSFRNLLVWNVVLVEEPLRAPGRIASGVYLSEVSLALVGVVGLLPILGYDFWNCNPQFQSRIIKSCFIFEGGRGVFASF